MHVLIRVQICVGTKFDHWIRIGKSRIIDEKERKRRDESPKKTPNFMYLEICRLLFFFDECSLESFSVGNIHPFFYEVSYTKESK